MASNYDSYKKLRSDQIPNNFFDDAELALGAGKCYGVKWIFNERGMQCHMCANAGGCCEQANGKCCLWTVPTNATRVTFEIWSGGGGGPGNTCCGCCTHANGGMGGNYAVKTITTSPGCQYRVCAGGAWRCNKAHTCTAGMGCKSYVTGHNLSNFCVNGGCGGHMCNGDAWGNTLWSAQCANCGICGIFGADFGIMGSSGGYFGRGYHHCIHKSAFTGQAPFIGKMFAAGTYDATCICGCYVNWPAGGGTAGISACYSGDAEVCCAGGVGQGGSGMVKITFG